MSIQSIETYNSITLIPTASLHYEKCDDKISYVSLDFWFLRWGITVSFMKNG